MKRYPATPSRDNRKWLESLQRPVTDSGYLVEIKPSARRRCRAVGEWVNRQGPVRRFESKPLAQAWARSLSGPGTTVWVQDAVRAADRDVDGYLVSGVRRGHPSSAPAPETQAGLEQF